MIFSSTFVPLFGLMIEVSETDHTAATMIHVIYDRHFASVRMSRRTMLVFTSVVVN